MARGRHWSEQELLVALHLYCRLPFGRLHSRNPEIIRFARLLERTPGSLAMKLANLASIDPGLERKGLCSVSAGDRRAWENMQSDWEHFARESEHAVQLLQQEGPLTEPQLPQPQELHDEIPVWQKMPEYTEREQLVKVRTEQPFFRNAVLSAYDRRCCISGLSLASLLEASHIVPWSEDRHNRSNPHNGLALSALHHKAFDAGLLTIDEQLRVCISRKVKFVEKDPFRTRALQHYHGQKILLPRKFAPTQEFLAHHRENIFEKRIPQ